MAGNVLWTPVFNKPGSQSQELTRQRIKQEDVCGRRPATKLPGPEFDRIVRGDAGSHSKLLADPWQPKGERHSIEPPLVGYGGTIPMVRPEHTGINNGEQAAHPFLETVETLKAHGIVWHGMVWYGMWYGMITRMTSEWN